MVKRIGVISIVLLIYLSLATSFSFAAGLNVLDNFPKEGASNSYPVNLGIKLYFDGDVADPTLRERNEQCFSLSGEDGLVPVKILYSDSDSRFILVMAEPPDLTYGLGSNKTYTLNVSEELIDNVGQTLGEPFTLTFTTRNTSGDMTVSMLLMGVMLVGMLVFTMMSTKRQAQKQPQKDSQSEKFNPYKIAKETGKSVKEVIADEEKRKKKAGARSTTSQTQTAVPAPKAKPRGRDRVFHLNKSRPISESGSTYITGRKAEAEKRAKALEEQRRKGTTKPKNTKAKKKKK